MSYEDEGWDSRIERTEEDVQRANDRHEEDVARETTVSQLNGTVEKVDKTAGHMWMALRIVIFCGVVMILFLVALQVQITRLNQATTDVDENLVTVDKAVTETQASVRHLESFVETLEAPDPDEQARNEATIRAVQLVPVILQVLCEVNPEAPSCQGG